MSVSDQPSPDALSGKRTLNDILQGELEFKVEDDPLSSWDLGVFLNELQRQELVVANSNDGTVAESLVAKQGLQKGTYVGTKLGLTGIYRLYEERHVSILDASRVAPIIPRQTELDQKKLLYQWSDPSDSYPPHLAAITTSLPDEATQRTKLFDKDKADSVGYIGTLFDFTVPNTIHALGTPFAGPTLADCEKYNKDHQRSKTDIMKGENIGCKADWYSDARFAQQHLSGVNPTTIETAPAEKIKAYIAEAEKQNLQDVKKRLSGAQKLLIQDYSYLREATGVGNDADFTNESTVQSPAKTIVRYACAPVIIFELHEDGRLHPLAITLDDRGSLDKSVTIFNRRLTPDDKGSCDEKDDWPWRYAKTCAQTADWARHQIAVHLVDTHLIEEAIIVATNRTIPEDHLLYEILSSHWYRTLALNEAARGLLVPKVITRLAGFGKAQAFGLINWSYKHFDFQQKYIPNDLKKRGFDIEATGNELNNYPYASCMHFLWGIIREFVQSVLVTQYKSDKDVQEDSYIPDWCKEIQTSGGIPTFPTITTVDHLVDAVTMCIHIASPQHTAVNYLQNYYYSFVPSKPPALCTPLPKDLKTLQAYTVKQLTEALPIGTEDQRWKDWLLAAQLPELLTYRVEENCNLLNYARSLWNVNKNRTVAENAKYNSVAIKEAAARFYSQLKSCELAFEYFSAVQTEGTVPYHVLQPETTAVSILI